MNNIETYNIKERFPVGDKGVVLLEYPTMQKRFAIDSIGTAAKISELWGKQRNSNGCKWVSTRCY